MWAIDGHDKLAPFGIFVHGCIDTFSRKVLWLKAYTTNHDPRVVASYFLKVVDNMKGNHFELVIIFKTGITSACNVKHYERNIILTL